MPPPDALEAAAVQLERSEAVVRPRRGGAKRCAAWPYQCFPFPGIGPEGKSNPVTLRIKYGIGPGISGIYPNPAAESTVG